MIEMRENIPEKCDKCFWLWNNGHVETCHNEWTNNPYTCIEFMEKLKTEEIDPYDEYEREWN